METARERSGTPRMRTGDQVLVEAWSIDGGHRIEEYEIVRLSKDSIALKHLFAYRRRVESVERIPADGAVIEHGTRMIEHLSIPFPARWEQHLSDMRWLCEKLAGG
jgi:hypothetical protein